MTEEERYCSLNIALLVHEMDVEGFEAVDLDGGLEVRKLIDLGLLVSSSRICLSSMQLNV